MLKRVLVTFQGPLLTMYGLNILLHAFGLVFLIGAYQSRDRSTQHLLVINLSVTEIFINILRLSVVCTFEYLSRESYRYFFYFLLPQSRYLYYLTMLYLTIDRLLLATIPVRYQNIWNISKTKVLLATTWTSIFIIFGPVITSIFWMYKNNEVFTAKLGQVNLSISLVLNIGTMATAIITYTVIYKRLTRNNRVSGASRPSFTQMLRNSQFYTSVLLVASYIVFAALPSLILAILMKVTAAREEVIFGILLLGSFSDTLDVFIYIFKLPSVYKLLKKKMMPIFRCFARKVEPAPTRVNHVESAIYGRKDSGGISLHIVQDAATVCEFVLEENNVNISHMKELPVDNRTLSLQQDDGKTKKQKRTENRRARRRRREKERMLEDMIKDAIQDEMVSRRAERRVERTMRRQKRQIQIKQKTSS